MIRSGEHDKSCITFHPGAAGAHAYKNDVDYGGKEVKSSIVAEFTAAYALRLWVLMVCTPAGSPEVREDRREPDPPRTIIFQNISALQKTLGHDRPSETELRSVGNITIWECHGDTDEPQLIPLESTGLVYRTEKDKF